MTAPGIRMVVVDTILESVWLVWISCTDTACGVFIGDINMRKKFREWNGEVQRRLMGEIFTSRIDLLKQHCLDATLL